MPVSIRGAIILSLIGGLVLGVIKLFPATTVLHLIDAQGKALKSCDLVFFEYNDAGWAPSPTPRLGEQKYRGADGLVTLKGDLPDEVLVQLTSPEFGVMYCQVTQGEPGREIRFGVPETQIGTVVGPDAKPLSGARVQVLAGGSHGILLADTKTDVRGRFTVANFSSLTEYTVGAKGGRSIGIRSLLFRVLARGYEVLEWDRSVIEDSPLLIALVPTRVVTGQVRTEHALEVGGLTLRSYRLPGLMAVTAADGSFEFDHLPGGTMRPSLFLSDLPPGYTQRMCKVEAGDRGVVVDVFRAATLRGYVINGTSRLPIVGAKVMHEHGPLGKQIVETNAKGEFVIPNVPPGMITLVGDILVRREGGQATVRGFDMKDQPSHIRRVVVQGRATVKVEEGVDQDDVIIRMY